MDWQRERLRKAIRDRNQKMVAVSRAIGRNLAYIQQFLETGTPKELSERDRAGVERFLGLADGWLRNPDNPLSAKVPTAINATHNPDNSGMGETEGGATMKEGKVNVLVIELERLLNKYGYEAIADALGELELRRRSARPHIRRGA